MVRNTTATIATGAKTRYNLHTINPRQLNGPYESHKQASNSIDSTAALWAEMPCYYLKKPLPCQKNTTDGLVVLRYNPATPSAEPLVSIAKTVEIAEDHLCQSIAKAIYAYQILREVSPDASRIASTGRELSDFVDIPVGVR